jgi:hypothetical protein
VREASKIGVDEEGIGMKICSFCKENEVQDGCWRINPENEAQALPACKHCSDESLSEKFRKFKRKMSMKRALE